MTVSINTAPISPLRQRMQHDMMMRGLFPHTQKDYVRHVKRLAAFLGRPPDTAAEEDLRRFQLMQHESGVRPSTINGTVSALRFLYICHTQGARSVAGAGDHAHRAPTAGSAERRGGRAAA